VVREIVGYLPHLNAMLNGCATVLLLTGWVLIKQRREVAHQRAMLGCFAISILFLASYLTYHGWLRAMGEPELRFPTSAPVAVRFGYYGILISHIILAATIPVLASVTIYLGWRDRRASHRRWARWTFPLWLYVSVTGVVIYVMLYQLYAA
jgi:uncharacterized membrane protein YozB (DUF420 family)